MKLTTIHSGNFKLDGGAMFGVVPKQLWNKLNPADEQNLCNWAMRCLLVEVDDRKILIDTGIGNKQSDKFYSHYDLNGPHSLDASLHSAGVSHGDITDVILTHLHFDHCGGAVIRDGEILKTAFPNATYYSTKEQWEHALNPNPREKASFLKENIEPIFKAGQLQYVKEGDLIAGCIELLVCNGHTRGMMTPLIRMNDDLNILYAADLFPSSAHLKPNFVMSYDIEPLKTMEERTRINQLAVQGNWLYYYEHDLNIETSEVAFNEKGQPVAVNPRSLSEVLAEI
ncbi:MAG: MBL fold metallo-hydrolase [Bacteroidia bacterium]